MKRRDFLCSMGCVLAGFALSELKKTAIDDERKNNNKYVGSKIPGFGIAMASHCNLNCKNCDVYAPLAKEEFVTYNQMVQDFTKLKKLYNNAEYADLTYIGGEPLLNPEFKKIIKKVHELFPYGDKNILTNGTLLNNMDDDFWKLSKKYIDNFAITRYPININRTEYENKAKKFGVRLNYDVVYSDKLYDKDTKLPLDFEYHQDGFPWSKNILDLTGSQNWEEKIYTCPHRGISIYARGNLYSCYVHAYIAAFIDYFKVDIPITENDFIKIADVKDKDEIEEFFCRPKPLCKYCKQCHNTCYGGEPLEWGFSERKITEWT